VSSLFVTQGRDQGARFELTSDHTTITLGRDPQNTVQLRDTEVSRIHAEIIRDGETLALHDLGSSNGSYINDRRIDRQEIHTGDRIRIGRTTLLFTKGGDSDVRDAHERVNIIDQHEEEEPSRIVSSLSQEEGNRLLGLDFDPTQSNWLARARGNLQIMYHTALAVSHTLDINQLLDRIMQLIFEWVEADRGCIMMIDQATGKLKPHVRRDRKKRKRLKPNLANPQNAAPTDDSAIDESGKPLEISQTILDFVLQHKEGVLTSNAREDQRWDSAASIVRQGVREAICVPMQGRYGLVGVIYIDTQLSAAQSFGGRKFNEDHLKLLVAIGHQAGLAIEDTHYYSALVNSERLAAMGQTIATLSHHIKNILQGIRGGSYLIEMGLGEHDEPLIRKGWDIVERNQKRISNMVLDMLTFSKDREPELTTADLNQTVGEVIELVQVRAKDKGIQLLWNPLANLPKIVFDDEGLHRAILNVVTNALDAVEENIVQKAEENEPVVGRVSVAVEMNDQKSWVRVIVEDNGPGIDPGKQADIFNMFISSKGSRGTGLGLPVSQKILHEHGGQIRVESDPPSGSRFIIEMPLVLPEHRESSPAHEARNTLTR
jgi:signal transduction histidine kinase/pSer/pThr/pTyr-binding forkhead associated (FHA) protein